MIIFALLIKIIIFVLVLYLSNNHHEKIVQRKIKDVS